MDAGQRVKRDLLQYFVAVGAGTGHRFTMRDFNLQVMMNAFSPVERAGLDLALHELIEAQVLQQVSETEYVLAAQGLTLVATLRGARGASGRTGVGAGRRRSGPTLSRLGTTAGGVRARP